MATENIDIGPNGNWHIDGIDQGVPARGPQGIAGVRGDQGLKGDSGPVGPTGPQGEVSQATLNAALDNKLSNFGTQSYLGTSLQAPNMVAALNTIGTIKQSSDRNLLDSTIRDMFSTRGFLGVNEPTYNTKSNTSDTGQAITIAPYTNVHLLTGNVLYTNNVTEHGFLYSICSPSAAGSNIPAAYTCTMTLAKGSSVCGRTYAVISSPWLHTQDAGKVPGKLRTDRMWIGIHLCTVNTLPTSEVTSLDYSTTEGYGGANDTSHVFVAYCKGDGVIRYVPFRNASGAPSTPYLGDWCTMMTHIRLRFINRTVVADISFYTPGSQGGGAYFYYAPTINIPDPNLTLCYDVMQGGLLVHRNWVRPAAAVNGQSEPLAFSSRFLQVNAVAYLDLPEQFSEIMSLTAS